MNTMITLLKREYWENRSGFGYTPIAIGTSLILFLLLALFNTEHFIFTHGEEIAGININGINISGMDFLGQLTKEFSSLSLDRRTEIWEMGFYGISTSFSFVMVLVSAVYLLGSLYDDRKDRSILFWKSLPVSDLMTVMSKIITVIFIIPAMYVAALTITFLLTMVVASFAALLNDGALWASIWQPAPFLKTPISLYITYVIQSLWAAPFLGWLLLVSSWTKRKPILIATIPVGLVIFGEFYYYRSTVFFDLVWERMVGWVAPISVTDGTHLGTGLQVTDQVNLYSNSFSLLNLTTFWYGLALATIFVAVAVYIRRYKDES